MSTTVRTVAVIDSEIKTMRVLLEKAYEDRDLKGVAAAQSMIDELLEERFVACPRS